MIDNYEQTGHSIRLVAQHINPSTGLPYNDPVHGYDCRLELDGKPIKARSVEIKAQAGREPVSVIIELCPSQMEIVLNPAEVTFTELALGDRLPLIHDDPFPKPVIE